ncbi:winged helix-turn-helix domain-containing protein [Streptomyces sp. NPDC050516]|uniref:AfsR/SARP family transcriptional regulator n=1 Tax=Streptomyces sp. NPDC050516 TaxID=3365621 RepID=UPI0037BDD3AB
MQDSCLGVETLGPLRAYAGGRELVLGPPKQRAVFGVLALSTNSVVSRDDLIDRIWGESPPATAAGSLHTYVSGLRRALAGLGDPLPSSGSGYALRLAPGQLDIRAVEWLAARARTSRTCPPPSPHSTRRWPAGGRAHDYRLVVQSYPAPLPPSTAYRYSESRFTRYSNGGCPFCDEDTNWARQALVGGMSRAIEAAADSVRVKFLDISDVFAGHELCNEASAQATEANSSSNPLTSQAAEWVRWVPASPPSGPQRGAPRRHPGSRPSERLRPAGAWHMHQGQQTDRPAEQHRHRVHLRQRRPRRQGRHDCHRKWDSPDRSDDVVPHPATSLIDWEHRRGRQPNMAGPVGGSGVRAAGPRARRTGR